MTDAMAASLRVTFDLEDNNNISPTNKILVTPGLAHWWHDHDAVPTLALDIFRLGLEYQF